MNRADNKICIFNVVNNATCPMTNSHRLQSETQQGVNRMYTACDVMYMIYYEADLVNRAYIKIKWYKLDYPFIPLVTTGNLKVSVKTTSRLW